MATRPVFSQAGVVDYNYCDFNIVILHKVVIPNKFLKRELSYKFQELGTFIAIVDGL